MRTPEFLRIGNSPEGEADPPATARHEQAGGGQAPGALHHVMGRGIENLKESKGYQWCAHSAIVGRVKREWQDTDMGYSGADVAHFLGINTSAVNRLAVSDEFSEVEKYV